jgi:ribosome maturation factor RimP
MRKKRVVDIVEEVLVPFLTAQKMELVDVEFVKEGPYRYLRVTIDNEAGISLDDCADVSRFLNDKLDRIDPIEEQYFLEVTSPGVERILKKDADFSRFAGSQVQMKLYQPYEGQKAIVGELIGLEEDTIVLHHDSMGTVKIPKSKVSLTKLVVDFD